MTDDLQSGFGSRADGPHADMDDLILYSMGVSELPADASPQAREDATIVGRVRNHLKTCAECRTRAAELAGDMGLLAMAAPRIEPPAGAKQRLFQAAGLDLAETSAKAAVPVTVMPIRPRRRSPFLIWGGWIAAAACIFYAVQIREANRNMVQQLQIETAQLMRANASAARAREIVDVLSSPRAQRVTLVAAHAKPQPAGQAVYLPNRGALVFTASHLAPLPTNKTYELWIIPASGAAPIPAGTFQPDARGMASVLLPKLPRGVAAKAFGVTMENAGGSTTPTMPILLAGG